MKDKRVIVHIINRTTFATDYIESMRANFEEYEHRFVLLKQGVDLNLSSYDNVYFVDSYRELRFRKEIYLMLMESHKIIVSGIWDMIVYLYMCGKRVLSKTYYHFWGGDFYRYRDFSSRELTVNKFFLKKSLVKSAGAIMLVERDYANLKDILGIPDIKHFVAPMCKDPRENIDYAYYRNLPKEDSTYRILVGNSATVYNQHEEIFFTLSKYAKENIEIICPLTYGKDEYRNEVIELGNKYFGKKFVALTKQLPKDEYVVMLSRCDVGIFNNNRQQAMGNITIFAKLGKKIYIRDDTAMWEHFQNVGYCFYSTNELRDATLEEIVFLDKKVQENNVHARENWEKKMIEMWDIVLED